jgi:hypothetical protein
VVDQSAGPPTGGDYFELLDKIHMQLQPRTYVEIGIRFGQSLALALPGTAAIGIDPAYDIRYVIDRSAQLFRLTSEEFFATHDVQGLFGGRPVDLAFIDGMHHFEVALLDFMNLERVSSNDSAILFHDCNPIDEASAGRSYDTSLWSGDVWKVIALLKEYRPDLAVHTVDVWPTGLGIIRNLDPASRVLEDRYDEIVDRFVALPYSHVDSDGGRAETLNLISSDWDAVRAALPPQPFRHDDATQLRRERSRRRPTVASVRYALRLRLRASSLGRLKRSVSGEH